MITSIIGLAMTVATIAAGVIIYKLVTFIAEVSSEVGGKGAQERTVKIRNRRTILAIIFIAGPAGVGIYQAVAILIASSV